VGVPKNAERGHAKVESESDDLVGGGNLFNLGGEYCPFREGT